MKLPAVICIRGCPLRRESRPHHSTGIEGSKAVQDQAPGDAIGPLPGIALGLHAQRPAVMRPRARGQRQRQQD